MSMGEMFNGSGGYSLQGGSSEAGGNDKVGGSISGNNFGVLPPLPTLNASLPSLPTFGSNGGGSNGMLLLLSGVCIAGVYLYMRGR